MTALEAVITALVGIIAVSYLIETVLDRPNWGEVLFYCRRFSGRSGPGHCAHGSPA